jgi:hypothetical protein
MPAIGTGKLHLTFCEAIWILILRLLLAPGPMILSGYDSPSLRIPQRGVFCLPHPWLKGRIPRLVSFTKSSQP